MQPEHISEWQQLQETALATLGSGNRHPGVRVLYLLVLPGWEPSTCYEIYRAQAQHLPASHILVVTRWRRDFDAAKFATPLDRLKHPHTLMPTVETQSLELTTELVNGMLDRFKALSIPTLTNTGAAGMDGTAYEVGLGNGFVWSRFHWWKEPPPEWQSLGTVFEDTVQEIERILAENA